MAGRSEIFNGKIYIKYTYQEGKRMLEGIRGSLLQVMEKGGWKEEGKETPSIYNLNSGWDRLAWPLLNALGMLT